MQIRTIPPPTNSLWIPYFDLKSLPLCFIAPLPKRVYCSYSRTIIYFLKTEYQQSMQYIYETIFTDVYF